MKLPAKIALAAALLSVGFAAITLVALESPEVVVLFTATGEGSWRPTRLWIADHDGAQWIEAASPLREFYRDLLANPEVEIERNGQRAAYRAVVLDGGEQHELIRRLLREKYGWADVWIGMLADTSHSIAVRLEPR